MAEPNSIISPPPVDVLFEQLDYLIDHYGKHLASLGENLFRLPCSDCERFLVIMKLLLVPFAETVIITQPSETLFPIDYGKDLLS
jgi:hypothetical protein